MASNRLNLSDHLLSIASNLESVVGLVDLAGGEGFFLPFSFTTPSSGDFMAFAGELLASSELTAFFLTFTPVGVLLASSEPKDPHLVRPP